MTVMAHINNSVAVITLDNTPVNSLGALVRTRIVEQLTLVQADIFKRPICSWLFLS